MTTPIYRRWQSAATGAEPAEGWRTVDFRPAPPGWRAVYLPPGQPTYQHAMPGWLVQATDDGRYRVTAGALALQDVTPVPAAGEDFWLLLSPEEGDPPPEMQLAERRRRGELVALDEPKEM